MQNDLISIEPFKSSNSIDKLANYQSHQQHTSNPLNNFFFCLYNSIKVHDSVHKHSLYCCQK